MSARFQWLVPTLNVHASPFTTARRPPWPPGRLTQALLVLDEETHGKAGHEPLQSHGDEAKDAAVIVQILALQLEVLHALFGLFLFAHVTLQALRLTASVTAGDGIFIRLEEGPQQVVRDLVGFQKRDESF